MVDFLEEPFQRPEEMAWKCRQKDRPQYMTRPLIYGVRPDLLINLSSTLYCSKMMPICYECVYQECSPKPVDERVRLSRYRFCYFVRSGCRVIDIESESHADLALIKSQISRNAAFTQCSSLAYHGTFAIFPAMSQRLVKSGRQESLK
jgi:hypothetical protein